jgi:hypothetical protein
LDRHRPRQRPARGDAGPRAQHLGPLWRRTGAVGLATSASPPAIGGPRTIATEVMAAIPARRRATSFTSAVQSTSSR